MFPACESVFDADNFLEVVVATKDGVVRRIPAESSDKFMHVIVYLQYGDCTIYGAAEAHLTVMSGNTVLAPPLGR